MSHTSKWRAERVVAESLRTRVAELEAAIASAPLAASVEELTEFERGDDEVRRGADVKTYGIHRNGRRMHGNVIEVHGDAALRDRILALLARPAAAPSVAPASPATGALADEQVDECVQAMRGAGFPSGTQGEPVSPVMRAKVRAALARAATFATAAEAGTVGRVQGKGIPSFDIETFRSLVEVTGESKGMRLSNEQGRDLLAAIDALAPAAPVEASDAQSVRAMVDALTREQCRAIQATYNEDCEHDWIDMRSALLTFAEFCDAGAVARPSNTVNPYEYLRKFAEEAVAARSAKGGQKT